MHYGFFLSPVAPFFKARLDTTIGSEFFNVLVNIFFELKFCLYIYNKNGREIEVFSYEIKKKGTGFSIKGPRES